MLLTIHKRRVCLFFQVYLHTLSSQLLTPSIISPSIYIDVCPSAQTTLSPLYSPSIFRFELRGVFLSEQPFLTIIVYLYSCLIMFDFSAYQSNASRINVFNYTHTHTHNVLSLYVIKYIWFIFVCDLCIVFFRHFESFFYASDAT